MYNPGTFFLSAGAIFVSMYIYSQFRSLVPIISIGSFTKVKRAILSLNAMRFSLFSKVCLIFSALSFFDYRGWIIFPPQLFPIAIMFVYYAIFTEEVVGVLGFNKLRLVKVKCEDLINSSIKRIDNGKTAFYYGSIGLLIFCYAANGLGNFLEMVFAGMAMVAIVSYVYNTTVNNKLGYSSYDEFCHRNLNYAGKTCYYKDGRKYTPEPEPESCDYYDRQGYRRDKSFFPQRV
jgi:hypothetical protein